MSIFEGHDRARWRPHVTTVAQVDLGEAWPGVRVVLRAGGRTVEKIFTVSPNTPVGRIRVRVAGADALSVDATGALVADTGRGPVTFTPPVAYQERDGVRRPVSVAYLVSGREYGFTVGPHDASLPLTIDPLLQSTYLGGGQVDFGPALAIHPTTGDVYVAGVTASPDFPGTAGGFQPTLGPGVLTVFVARLSADLKTLIRATFLGGSDVERASGLAIHPANGDVYVVGTTASPDFPGTTGGAQAVHGGGSDVFVARLSADLTTLRQATYLGGTDLEFEDDARIAIHPTTGDVYVVGTTFSDDFPGTATGAQPRRAGSLDAFVARLNAGLTTLVRATYLGGTAVDRGLGLAVHPVTGGVYVGGLTSSGDFPGTAGGAQSVTDGSDAFVALLDPTLTTLVQATYLGGKGSDTVAAVAVHPATGEVYVAGSTGSPNFPGTLGSAQSVNHGLDAFVARLDAALTTLPRATYLGGQRADSAELICHAHDYSRGIYAVANQFQVVWHKMKLPICALA